MNTHKYIRSLSAVVVTAVVMAVSGCHRHHEPQIPAPEPEPAPEPTTPRTVLVYMVADNNLGTGAFDSSDLKEMQLAADRGDLGKGRLLVYHASNDDIVLKEIRANGVDTLKVYDSDLLSVSIERMTQVIDDTHELAPADDYGMILWSHASGWLQDGILDTYRPQRSFGYDGLTKGKSMNITSLARALNGAGMTWLYFDCCFMGTVEVMYELRNAAQYIIASPAEIPAPGMPYDRNLKYMFDTTLSVEEMMVKAATSTFDTYNDVFVKGDCPNTMSVVRTQHLDRLAQVTRMVYTSTPLFYNTEYDYQQFGRGSYANKYYDLGQYIESIHTDQALMDQWTEALDDVIAYADASPWIWDKIPVECYCGLSTYILRSANSINTSNYNTLSWYEDVAAALVK